MNIEKTIDSLKRNGYTVSIFETGKEVVDYLKDIKGKTIGFGGSQTLTDLHLKDILSENNTVYVPDFPETGEDFVSTANKAMNTQLYFLSANALSENGEIVNIDAGGNRLAGSMWGHEKVYFIIGTNKIEENLDKAIWRARNIAAPLNSRRFHLKNPCALGEMKCYDCKSPSRLCKGMLVMLQNMENDTEVILVNEELGF
ncbi:MAG: lactate utilization protein [Erysipelotrichaceae bacterium]|nr:lactate utilization protein [Erysipelotrichaceae bacterium]